MNLFKSRRQNGKQVKQSGNKTSSNGSSPLAAAHFKPVRSLLAAYAQLLYQGDSLLKAGKTKEARASFSKVFRTAIQERDESSMQEAAWGIIASSFSAKEMARGGMQVILKTANTARSHTVSDYFKKLMTEIVEKREVGVSEALKVRHATLENNKRSEMQFRQAMR